MSFAGVGGSSYRSACHAVILLTCVVACAARGGGLSCLLQPPYFTACPANCLPCPANCLPCCSGVWVRTRSRTTTHHTRGLRLRGGSSRTRPRPRQATQTTATATGRGRRGRGRGSSVLTRGRGGQGRGQVQASRPPRRGSSHTGSWTGRRACVRTCRQAGLGSRYNLCAPVARPGRWPPTAGLGSHYGLGPPSLPGSSLYYHS